jgi:hypothetical protein
MRKSKNKDKKISDKVSPLFYFKEQQEMEIAARLLSRLSTQKVVESIRKLRES